MDISKIQYVLLPGQLPPRSPDLDLYNTVYKYWKNFWEAFWQTPNKEGNQNKPPLAELFSRQHVIHCFFYEARVIGMVSQTIYDLNQLITKDLPYFHYYDEELFAYLNENHIETLVTHEYLTVDPLWRKSNTGFSLGPWLMGCGAMALKALEGHASVAIARKDIGVHKLCYSLGWTCVKEDVSYKGYPCDIITLLSGNEQLEPSVNHAVNHLWNRRINKTNLHLGEQIDDYQSLRRAA